jgi:hypothetical protein
MSQENVEIVRQALAAYSREGLDGYLRYFDPEIEWTSTGEWIEGSNLLRSRGRPPLSRLARSGDRGSSGGQCRGNARNSAQGWIRAIRDPLGGH